MRFSDHRTINLALLVAGIGCFGWLVIRQAWLCDDAFITFRVVDNFINGYGLRWNVIERVQVSTHPLWCLMLIGLRGWFTNLPLATLWLSIGLSTLAFALVVPRPGQAPVGLFLLACFIPASKSVVDFATSGLEGPLGYLLLGLFILACGGLAGSWRRTDTFVPALAAAIILTRPDYLLLIAPCFIVWFSRKPPGKSLRSTALGASILLGWAGFAFVYYGYIFPNTALAKLNTGVPLADKIGQGLTYVLDFMVRDMGGALAVIFCLVLLILRRKDRQAASVAVGIGLYILYIVFIGGDFMSGRFFAVVVFVVVAEAIRSGSKHQPHRVSITTCAGAVAVVMLLLRVVGFNGFSPTDVTGSEITDERRFYAPVLSLAAVRDGRPIESLSWYRKAKELPLSGPLTLSAYSVGIVGFYAGPTVHLIDHYALTDPLLSRLPARSGCRVGHYERRIPNGYEDSVRTRHLMIPDPDLNEFTRVLWTVTRDPVWSASRLRTVVGLSSGRYKPLMKGYLERAGEWHKEPVDNALSTPGASVDQTVRPN